MSHFWFRLARLNAPFLAAALRGLADQVEALIPGPPVAVVLLFKLKGRIRMGEITVADDEANLTSTITPLDAEGAETTLDTPPTYSSSDETVATVTASADGLSATYAIGTVGDAVITVDTGLTDGDGNLIQGKGTIHVTPGGVATLDVEFAVPGT